MFLLSQITLAVFSLCVLGGGIMGYVKAKSKPSLIAGIASSILLDVAFIFTLLASLQMVSPVVGTFGLIAGDLVSIALSIMFFIRFNKTGAFMPAGLMIILSSLSAIILSLTIFAQAPKP